ncbi:MAG: signal peptidase I [Planctomycetes bacterium]|nr:signal peptidase I [Planctomycetota bacterium]
MAATRPDQTTEEFTLESARQVAREWGESLGIALVLALILRHFVVEAFKIPTKSMEPTLVGDTASGDKILVNKFVYDFSRPQRGDVIVFKYPEDPFKNYIKRLIGLPGEEIWIARGDIRINGQIWRKPRSVQRALWVPVSNDDLLWDEIAAEELHYPVSNTDIENWQLQHWGERAQRVAARRLNTAWLPSGMQEWTSHEDGLRARQDASASEPALVRYHLSKVYDRTLESSGKLKPLFQDRPGSLNLLDDLAIRFSVVPETGEGEIFAFLADSDRSFTARVALGHPAPVVVEARHKGKKEADPERIEGPPCGLAPGKSARLALVNVDDAVILEVDHRPLITHPYESAAHEGDGHTVRAEVAFGLLHGTASFTNIALERDIYYVSDLFGITSPEGRWKIGEREYFVLGDNSPNSKDSRLWETGPAVPEENLVGEAFMVFWPPKRLRIIR